MGVCGIIHLLISQNHIMACVGKDLKDYKVPNSFLWIGTPSTRPDSKVPSNLKLISSRDGASTPSLSSLFHCPDCKEFLFNIKSKSAFLQFENIWYILCAFYTVCPQNSAVPSAEAHRCIRGSETSPFAV